MRRLAAIVACVLGGAVLLGGAVEAHANYVRSNPASDARLVKPPTEIRIEFSEPPDPKGSDIQVFDTTGKRQDTGDVGLSGDPNGLRVSVGAIPDGGYTVAWTTTSAVDGHTTKGSFAFGGEPVRSPRPRPFRTPPRHRVPWRSRAARSHTRASRSASAPRSSSSSSLPPRPTRAESRRFSVSRAR